MKQGVCLAAGLCAVVLALSAAMGHFYSRSVPAAEPVVTGQTSTLILDAGHGGEDGGAVSPSGTRESQINLDIVLKLDDLLGLYGTAPVLLRDSDISLHDSDCVTLREKKVSDLKNRVEAIESTENAVLISIHQNSYPDGRYHGTQSFYAPTEGSKALAQQIQSAVQASLQPDNDREIKQIPDTIYLMNHIDCPAVLVECGFLTNEEEEARLRDEDYQRKLAAVLMSAWLNVSEGSWESEA